MNERVCFRCDWTGVVGGAACPRCGTALYEPVPPEPRTPDSVATDPAPDAETERGWFCLRCDWTGRVGGAACPRCGTPIYRLGRPEPPTAGGGSRSHPPPAGRGGRSPAEPSRDDDRVSPSRSTVRGSRGAIIVLALVVAAVGFGFGFIGRTEPDARVTLGGIEELEGLQDEAPSILEVPDPSLGPPPAPPSVCPGDGVPPALEPPAEVEAVVADAAADYRFQGSLASSVGTAPDLVEIGDGTTGFGDEGMIGRTVLSFSRTTGLSLAPASAVVDAAYTIELLFRFDQVGGYRKVVDFRDGSDDGGLYVLEGCLNFFPRPPISPTTIGADMYVQVVLTRNASETVRVYLDGVLQLSFRDRQGLAVAGEGGALRFFVDDSVTGGVESSGGAVSQIRLYDRPLSPGEVAGLACAELRIPLTSSNPCQARAEGS